MAESTNKIERDIVIGEYVTCLKGHNMTVVWVPMKQQFAFNCDECAEIFPFAVSIHGTVGFRIVNNVVRRG